MRSPEPSSQPEAPVLARVLFGLLLILLAGGIGVTGILGGLAVAPLLVDPLIGAAAAPPAVATLYTLTIFAPIGIVAGIAALLVPGAAPGLGRQPIGWLLAGIAIGAAGLLITASLAGLAGVIERVPTPPTALAIVALGAVVTLVQSGAEELLLHGLFQPALTRQWGAATAVVGASLLFMGLHLVGGPRSLIEIVNLVLAGTLFGMLALRTGGLAAPVAAHWAWNSTETLALGLSPNPGIGDFGALADLDMRGSALWGGSEYGLNGSIAAAFVLVALIVPLLVWRPRAAAMRAAPGSAPKARPNR